MFPPPLPLPMPPQAASPSRAEATLASQLAAAATESLIPPEIPSGTAALDAVIVMDSTFRTRAVSLIEPALLDDVKAMINGRKVWRRASSASEVSGRILAGVSSVLAFAASSELTRGTVSSILAFSAGCSGTAALVLTLFATFSRTQALERTAAINTVFRHANIQAVPDVMQDLAVNEE